MPTPGAHEIMCDGKPFDPPLPGTGEIIAIAHATYGLVAIRKGEPPYILLPGATKWESLKVN